MAVDDGPHVTPLVEHRAMNLSFRRRPTVPRQSSSPERERNKIPGFNHRILHSAGSDEESLRNPGADVPPGAYEVPDLLKQPALLNHFLFQGNIWILSHVDRKSTRLNSSHLG